MLPASGGRGRCAVRPLDGPNWRSASTSSPPRRAASRSIGRAEPADRAVRTRVRRLRAAARDRPRRLGDGVDAGTGVELAPDVEPVVPDEGLEDARILWKLLLGKARHDTARIWQGHADPYVFAHRERMADPIVFDESSRRRLDDHVHTEPPSVEVALRLAFAQLVKRRRRDDAEREEVEERVCGHSGRQALVVEEGRAESCFDDSVAMPLGIVVLLVRVALIDRVAVLRGDRQLHVAPEEARQDRVDIRRVAQHRLAVGKLDPRRWKLVPIARRSDERRPTPEQVGPELRVFRTRDLARRPIPAWRKGITGTGARPHRRRLRADLYLPTGEISDTQIHTMAKSPRPMEGA